jgi:hypothetical protein
VTEVELRCSECAATSLAQVRWSFDVSAAAYEPAFGLKLRLQTSCRRHVLWAYNPRHLEFLHNFVEARIRERVPNQNRTLVSRLPRWIKSAQNREAVLKAIATLESECGSGA